MVFGPGSRIAHPSYGDGVVVRVTPDTYDICFMLYGVKEISRDYDKFHVIEALDPDGEIDVRPIEKALIKVLRQFSDVSEVCPIGERWQGGTLILQPKDRTLKPKELPVEQFFNKIIMTRDRLRVMEQRINASNLSEEEKINLQQYITRIYGSLTTFNVLFKLREDYFVGEGGKD